MPSVVTYQPTGDAYVDGVLGDLKWAVNAFTFSFPASASYYGTSYGYGETTDNFGVLGTAQQAAVRMALSAFASVAQVTFTEIAETSSQHADLRFARSDAPATAWAYYPTTAAEGGDVWFNKSSGWYDSPVLGNYAYMTVLHEIGHALGLEHAHEHFVMPEDRDSMESTVMSYRSYVGASTSAGYTNETGGYAQSLMMYDIAALQHMYGANFSTRSGNTTYQWSPTTGELFIDGAGQGAPVQNRIFQTVWDGNGVDTYDFSLYATNLSVDLRPGRWTTVSADQVARLHWDGSKVAAGNIANALQYGGDPRSLIENAVGGAGNDVITGNQAANVLSGNAGDDRLTGGAGDDVLEGAAGSDTALFNGAFSDYSATHLEDGSVRIADLRSGSADGTDTIRTVELFQFSDRIVARDDLVTVTTVVVRNLTLTGDAGANTLSGGGGDDVIDGRAGADRLYGTEGDDRLIGGAGKDVLDGGAGSDTASYATAAAGLTADLLYARSNSRDAAGDLFVSIENLMGSAYADSLRGNDAANLLTGGGGNDTFYGRGGNDQIVAGTGRDFLDGGSGNDVLSAGSGNDTLLGGSGADLLTGGSGADLFRFDAVSHSPVAARDTVQDFLSGLDRIDLSRIDANSRISDNQAFVFIGGQAFGGVAGQLRFASGVLSGDVDGNGSADFAILIGGGNSLVAADIIL